MKVAICYWGMTRSTKFVYESHINKLFNILKTNNIDYNIFMHTWKTKNDENIIWESVSSIPVDYEEYKLLNPDYYQIDNQNDFLKSILSYQSDSNEPDNYNDFVKRLIFSDYFKKELFDRYGGDTEFEWRPQLLLNHLCALESQKRVYNMVVNAKKDYDFIIFMRPDVDLISIFDVNWLNCDFDIILNDYDDFDGFNDRFAILPFNNAAKYAERIDEAKEYRKDNYRISAERYLKFIVDKYYSKPIFVHLNTKIIRPNGP